MLLEVEGAVIRLGVDMVRNVEAHDHLAKDRSSVYGRVVKWSQRREIMNEGTVAKRMVVMAA